MGDNLTRKSLIDTLDQFSDYDTGITLPITYHPGPTCAKIIRLTASGAWTVVTASYCL